MTPPRQPPSQRSPICLRAQNRAINSARPPQSLSAPRQPPRSEEHTSELQSRPHLVCRLLLEKKKLSKSCSTLLTFTSMHGSPFTIRYGDRRFDSSLFMALRFGRASTAVQAYVDFVPSSVVQ